jgi:hypothetical protein
VTAKATSEMRLCPGGLFLFLLLALALDRRNLDFLFLLSALAGRRNLDFLFLLLCLPLGVGRAAGALQAGAGHLESAALGSCSNRSTG